MEWRAQHNSSIDVLGLNIELRNPHFKSSRVIIGDFYDDFFSFHKQALREKLLDIAWSSCWGNFKLGQFLQFFHYSYYSFKIKSVLRNFPLTACVVAFQLGTQPGGGWFKESVETDRFIPLCPAQDIGKTLIDCFCGFWFLSSGGLHVWSKVNPLCHTCNELDPWNWPTAHPYW